MAMHEEKKQGKHVGTIPDNSQDKADEKEKDDNRKPKSSKKVKNDVIGQDDVNVLTDTSKGFRTDGVELTKDVWKQHGLLWKVRNIGMLAKMDAGDAYFRNAQGQLLHSEYVIKMWNKVKNTQTGLISAGKGLKMLGDAFGAYEQGRRLR